MAAAYVFVHVMPELHDAREVFAESVLEPARYAGAGIYFVALIGFLSFYGLDHWRRHLDGRAGREDGERAFRLHISGFAAYVGLLAYLLVNNIEETEVTIGIYAVAIALHLLGVDHELRREHGMAYERVGRFVLAGIALAGWAVALIVTLPPFVLALLVAFVSGAIVMNSAVMELPSNKDGRFLPFLFGGLVYGAILLPLA